jgi:hypothetical protein
LGTGCKQWLLHILRDDLSGNIADPQNLTPSELTVNTRSIDRYGSAENWQASFRLVQGKCTCHDQKSLILVSREAATRCKLLNCCKIANALIEVRMITDMLGSRK